MKVGDNWGRLVRLEGPKRDVILGKGQLALCAPARESVRALYNFPQRGWGGDPAPNGLPIF